MAEATKSSNVKPGLIVLGLALTAATLFVGAWAIGKGWKTGSK